MEKVKVDPDACEANGLCEAVAPDIFDLGDEDVVQIADGTLTEENRDRIEQAVAACPKSALSIVDE